MILLDALQADGQHRRKLGSCRVGALYKCRIIVVLGIGELVIGIPIPHKGVPCRLAHGGHAVADLADLPQFGTGNDRTGFIHDANHAVDGLLHLVHHVLEYPVRHSL